MSTSLDASTGLEHDSGRRAYEAVTAVATSVSIMSDAVAQASGHTVSYAACSDVPLPMAVHDDVQDVVNAAPSAVTAVSAAREAAPFTPEASRMVNTMHTNCRMTVINNADRRHTAAQPPW